MKKSKKKCYFCGHQLQEILGKGTLDCCKGEFYVSFEGNICGTCLSDLNNKIKKIISNKKNGKRN